MDFTLGKEGLKMDEYWEEKIKKAVVISEEYGYVDLDRKYWMNIPAILVSMVVEIYESKERLSQDYRRKFK